MNGASRPAAAGRTRTCPHCKATILESLTTCPGCLRHLRFDQEAAQRQVAATSALRVEGVICHPPAEDPWEYFVVLCIRNDRGEEMTRQVVSVGALQSSEKRTFTVSVDMMPQPAPPPAVGSRPLPTTSVGSRPPATTPAGGLAPATSHSNRPGVTPPAGGAKR